MNLDINSSSKSGIDIWIILFIIGLITFGIGSVLFLSYPQMTGAIWDPTKIVLGPLVGAFVGVFLGFRKKTKHQEKLNQEKKLFLLSTLRHEVRKSIELLQEKSGNLIPIDAWNSIVYSGNIVLFTGPNHATMLSDIYFDIENYNYEAKRTRDASERFNSLAEPSWRKYNVEPTDHKNWRLAKERWEGLSNNLGIISTALEKKLLDLEREEWFKEGKDN